MERVEGCVQEGEVGIFLLNGEGYIKRLGDRELLSLNPKYGPIALHDYDDLPLPRPGPGQTLSGPWPDGPGKIPPLKDAPGFWGGLTEPGAGSASTSPADSESFMGPTPVSPAG